MIESYEQLAPSIEMEQLKVSGNGWMGASHPVAASFASAVLDGTEPCTAYDQLKRKTPIDELLPQDAWVIRRHINVARDNVETVYARCPEGGILIDDTRIYTSAATKEAALAIARQITGRVPEPESTNTVPMRLWNAGSHGPNSVGRDIEAPLWDEICANYPRNVAPKLAELMGLVHPESGVSGKLVIWHGLPGTGKTTAIRALMREWAPWCSSHYVADPEIFFASAEYISDVMTSNDGDSDCCCDDDDDDCQAKKYRLVIAEDCDEFIGANARVQSGSALGRLLNLADGILGQGSDVVILLTTNEDIDSLHPALIRPGRCMSKIEFGAFSTDEAQAWLGDEHELPNPRPTLAELFEARSGAQPVAGSAANRAPVGFHM
ncbi:MAG: ATP-binding protein [Propionibacteriaceae bacterium]|jgi:hypothetical protein|nr:ATP-binding protein [Propionibacteriaceae bacterium]